MSSVTSEAQDAVIERVLDAARACCVRWGIAKVTIDDIASEAGMSRATLYRLFPGGREVLFEAMREQGISSFLAELDAQLADAEDLDHLVAAVISHAIVQLRADTQLQLLMASQPGEVARSLGVESMPRIIRLTTAFLGPRFLRFLDAERAGELAEWVSRVVVSYFLAPSTRLDLADPACALGFVRRFVTPAFVFPNP